MTEEYNWITSQTRNDVNICHFRLFGRKSYPFVMKGLRLKKEQVACDLLGVSIEIFQNSEPEIENETRTASGDDVLVYYDRIGKHRCASQFLFNTWITGCFFTV